MSEVNVKQSFNEGKTRPNLYRSLILFGIIGVLTTSLLVAVVSITPLYANLKASREEQILIAAKTKAEVVAAILKGVSDVADQIAGRSTIRDAMILYRQGEISRNELVRINQPKLLDSLQLAKSLAGIQLFDRQENLLLEVGTPIPEGVFTQLSSPFVENIKPFIQPIRIGQKRYLITARPILDSSNQFVGSDLFMFSPNAFDGLFSDLNNLAPSVVAGLEFSGSGKYDFFLSSRPLSVKEESSHVQAIRQMTDQQFILMDPNSSSIMIAGASAKATGWTITIQIDKGDLYNKVYAQVLRVTIVTIFLVVLGTGILVFLLKPLTRGMLIHEKELQQLVAEKAQQYQDEYEERLAAERNLRILNTRFQSVIQSARDAIILTDQDANITDWNSAAEEILGYEVNEMIGQPLYKLLPERLVESKQSVFSRFIKNPETYYSRSRQQLPARRKDGSEFPADISFSRFELEGKTQVAFILRDISELRRIEQALEQSQARYKSMIEDVVDASSVAICITDPQFRVVWENLTAVIMWGLDRKMIVDCDKRELLTEHIASQIDQGEEFVQSVLESYAQNQHLENIEIHFPARPGRNESWLLYSSKPIRVGYYAGGRIEQYVDITEQKLLLSQIEQMAVTDELTGICNRRGLFEHGKRDIARAHRLTTPLCVLFLDIDHFKYLNDHFGHDQGDLVLKQLSGRIQSHIREFDLFARYGGEEFVILLPDTSAEHAGQIAERIRKTVIETSFPFLENQNHVTVSIGVESLGPEDTLQVLIKKADQLMYVAKQNGRNRVEWIEPV
jgi:diguanylate cyclase (GGDEF)-like protein/PAS domain S-box-containing protein